MNQFLLNGIMKNKTNSSNIQIYYNRQFPLRDIIDVLYPLFYNDYAYEGFISIITKADHVFCAYDQIRRRCVACGIVNNAGKKGGLYLTLFGVRKSSQHHGLGTQLLKTIIQWARRTRHAFIYLHVNAGNFKAIGLYQKLGFRTHEYLPNYYGSTPKEDPAGIRMVLLL